MADPLTAYARFGDLPLAVLIGGLLIFGLRMPRNSGR
jgi:hypothetical protein